MKKMIFLFITTVFLFSCTEERKDSKDLITVYGDLHTNINGALSLESYPDHFYKAWAVQKWLVDTVSENIVMIESEVYTGIPITMDDMLNSGLSQKTIDYYISNILDARFRFVYDGKEVYGSEDVRIFKRQTQLVSYTGKNLYLYIDEFYRLNDLRNEYILENAKKTMRNKK